MTKFVALLRGINVEGNKKVPMDELKSLYTSLGFTNITTLLNSGNVIFETNKKSEVQLVQTIESAFLKHFGFESKTMIRNIDEIKNLIDLDPFRNISVNKNIRLYVSFLREVTPSSLVLPFKTPENDFSILQRTDREIFSVLDVQTARSVDAMKILEQEYGNDITTRNWNTVFKIVTKGL